MTGGSCVSLGGTVFVLLYLTLARGDSFDEFQKSSTSSVATTTVDVNTEYAFNICNDNLQRAETNFELRTSNAVETLQLDQFGKIWALSNRSFPVNVACTLHLSACANCLIQLSWNSGQTKIILDPAAAKSQSQPISSRTCEKPWDFKDFTCFGVNFVEENADRLSYRPYRRFSALDNNTQIHNYTSTTYKLEIYLYSWRMSAEDLRTVTQLFPLEFRVIDNSVTRRGRPSTEPLSNRDSEGYIESPRFPKTYPEGVTVNYTLINEDPSGFVRLMFSDFELHYMSSLEIIDSNGNNIKTATSSYGTSGRPCAVQSSGPTLMVVFTANHYTHEIGFRAQYKFVKEDYWAEKPSCKICDKLFDDKGGFISIDSLDLDVNSFVDCIWVVSKSRFAQPIYDKLYMKVEEFSLGSTNKGVQLEVFAGQHSTARRMLSIFGPRTKEQLARDQPQGGFVSDFSDLETTGLIEDKGFYIRLKGYLGSYSGLGVIFAQFYLWATATCHDTSEFHCDNGRCIQSRLRCDGHDHCGDFSDESKESCQDRKIVWPPANQPRPTFDDPNASSSDNRFPFNYTTTILLVAGLIGLTLVMLMVTVIVARVYRQRLIRRLTAQRRSQSMSSNQASFIGPSGETTTGSRPGPSIHQVGNRRLLVLPESDIGVFEAPPTYDDALKHPTVPPGRSAMDIDMHVNLPVLNAGVTNTAFLDDSGRASTLSSTSGVDTAPNNATAMTPRLRSSSVSSTESCGSGSFPRSPAGSRSSVSSLGTVEVEHDPEEPSAFSSAPVTGSTVPVANRLNGILNWAKHHIKRNPEAGSVALQQANNSQTSQEDSQPSTSTAVHREEALGESSTQWTQREPLVNQRETLLTAAAPLSAVAQNQRNECLEMQGTLV